MYFYIGFGRLVTNEFHCEWWSITLFHCEWWTITILEHYFRITGWKIKIIYRNQESVNIINLNTSNGKPQSQTCFKIFIIISSQRGYLWIETIFTARILAPMFLSRCAHAPILRCISVPLVIRLSITLSGISRRLRGYTNKYLSCVCQKPTFSARLHGSLLSFVV
jgi:hypothetical protein